jgi:hypothetical protein
VCSNGACAVTCASNLLVCARSTAAGVDGGGERYCADPQSDRANCGACGNACASGPAL